VNTINQEQPDINAKRLFDTGKLVLGNNVKHLIILIPNEGHHGPYEDNEARFIAQPFAPQDAIVNKGTQVSWFAGDVGHDHTIEVRTAANNETVFYTGVIPELTASKTITFNNTGDFNYLDPTPNEESSFVMTGNIAAIDQPNTSSSGQPYDTVGVLMVPSMLSDSTVQSMQSAGLQVDSVHNFKDLRGGQSDTGDVQTLIVWTASGIDMSKIESGLNQISTDLPYE